MLVVDLSNKFLSSGLIAGSGYIFSLHTAFLENAGKM